MRILPHETRFILWISEKLAKRRWKYVSDVNSVGKSVVQYSTLKRSTTFIKMMYCILRMSDRTWTEIATSWQCRRRTRTLPAWRPSSLPLTGRTAAVAITAAPRRCTLSIIIVELNQAEPSLGKILLITHLKKHWRPAPWSGPWKGPNLGVASLVFKKEPLLRIFTQSPFSTFPDSFYALHFTTKLKNYYLLTI